MIPEDLAKKIRYLQIYTNKAVNNVLAGGYESTFKGRGMEFDEVREYQPGDDIRTIDWNVTARTGQPYIKRYVEERELTVMFLVDLSASGDFGSIEKKKNEVAAELCALVAFAAIKNNDKVGLIVFTDGIEMFIPPQKGVSHVLRIIRELLYFSPKNRGTDIAAALEYLGKVMPKRGVVFLVSDFISNDFSKPLRIVSRKHDMIAVSITDALEMSLPDAGLIEVADAETGQVVTIDSSNKKVRKQYEKFARLRVEWLSGLLASMGIDQIPIVVRPASGQDDHYVKDLAAFFRRRERRAA